MTEIKETLTYAAGDSAKSTTLFENGIMIGYTLVQPNYTTAVSGILTIKDKDSYTVYTGDSKAENTTAVVMGLTIPMGREYTATLTLNDVAGGAHTATLKLYIDTRNN